VDDTNKSVSELPRESTLAGYAEEKALATSRIAVAIVANAALFVIWIGVACLAQLIAGLARRHGFNEHFADAFMWISSASTLFLALLYIIADLSREFRRLFHSRRKRTEATR
jgi:hypothetical protein